MPGEVEAPGLRVWQGDRRIGAAIAAGLARLAAHTAAGLGRFRHLQGRTEGQPAGQVECGVVGG